MQPIEPINLQEDLIIDFNAPDPLLDEVRKNKNIEHAANACVFELTMDLHPGAKIITLYDTLFSEYLHAYCDLIRKSEKRVNLRSHESKDKIIKILLKARVSEIT